MAAAVVNSIRSFLERGRYRYRPLGASSAVGVGDDESESQATDAAERTREPLLYSEPHRRQRNSTRSSGGENVLNSVWARGNRPVLKLSLILVSFGLVLYLGVAFSRVAGTRGRSRDGPPCDTPDHGYQCHPTIAQYWGQYSPFFSVPPEDADAVSSSSDTLLPPGCRFTFAQVLSRHGGRDPTSGKSEAYDQLITRILASVDSFVDGPYGKFGFLNDYTYRLGADELNRFGEQQMVNSGNHFYHRYKSLILSPRAATSVSSASSSYIEPFVRSADQHRVVLSAINWIEGFQKARRSDLKDNKGGESQQILLLPEKSGFNNTLSYNGLCKKFSSQRGSQAEKTFAATFVPPITERLNRGLEGANLSDTETIYLMDLCPFETIADDDDAKEDGHPGIGGRRLSPFCRLFSDAEWHDYDYYQTLGKWYGFGAGSDLGATQGVGFVNELIARLTSSPVDDHTSTNRTLDSDPATFPLNATVYADFSHDNDMSNVFAALGLYNVPDGGSDGSAPLQPSNTTRTEPEDLRGFSASWTVPFAARMYVEKMVCDGDSSKRGQDDEELVRILVNDRVIPLQNCGADQYGRCTLSRFVDSLSFARGGGRWDDCFA